MNCPICESAGLKETDVSCSTCKSDLSSLRLLDDLAARLTMEALPRPVPVPVSTPKLWMGTTAVLVACVAGLLYKVASSSPTTAVNISPPESVTIPQEKPAAVSSASRYKYAVKKGDNLYTIAKFFYGNGNLYPQIMRDNNLPEGASIQAGDSLIIDLK